jgi:hypothetical protein
MRVLTKENMAEAKKDLRLLNDPTSLCCGVGYYAVSLQDKWGNLNELSKAIKVMELESASTEGAGI